ncbi:DUF5348 domain-containing protein [Anaerocolumna sp. AGMB13025]|uniref:DUF5348 domain-containing protein n=1 Tax=Anaerocolumna sp. AGMB13025 TaxID=3039116 RepID=UPI00241D0D72|nr:DUF5348 domain-containing protein [Anaerocolumna sp. AGMB13025]WFR55384.1 DUF5348 domain-containing protein [Anaerocolumna sp. AGMB13025]
MDDLQKVLHSCKVIGNDIKAVLQASTYSEYDDMSGLQINYDDPEQLFLLDELKGIMESLDRARDRIYYLNKPVKNTEYLHKNSRGRYETSFQEFTCGSGIEVYLYDDFWERYRWVRTYVEHDGNDYYLVGHNNVSLENLKVRIRG